MRDDEYGQCWLIPEVKPVPSLFEPSYAPGPFDPDNVFSEEELSEIKAYGSRNFKFLIEKLEIPWEIEHRGRSIKPGEITWNGREDVFTTTPMSSERSSAPGRPGNAEEDVSGRGFVGRNLMRLAVDLDMPRPTIRPL